MQTKDKLESRYLPIKKVEFAGNCSDFFLDFDSNYEKTTYSGIEVADRAVATSRWLWLARLVGAPCRRTAVIA